MKTHIAIALAGGMLLSACGGREPLQPAQGEGMPVAPAMAQSQPTTDDLLETTQQRPERVDELLRRSQEREDDPFDLPPPG